MNPEIFVLPDGAVVGTGLLVPNTLAASFPEYSTAGPVLSMDDVVSAAKSGMHKGKDRFDRTWVKNQRSHGSCNGFAGASALSKARVRRLGAKYRVDLSGAYAYSLMNGGSDNGSTLDDGMAVVSDNGVCPETMAGWDAIYPNRYNKAKCDAAAAKYKGFECYAVRTEIELFSALVAGFDCVVAVHADNGFMRLDNRGVAQGGNGPGNHAVHADGVWWDGELIADGQNSWDVTYGNAGRMGLTWSQHFSHTTRYHPFYAIRSTLDSPDNPVPAHG